MNTIFNAHASAGDSKHSYLTMEYAPRDDTVVISGETSETWENAEDGDGQRNEGSRGSMRIVARAFLETLAEVQTDLTRTIRDRDSHSSLTVSPSHVILDYASAYGPSPLAFNLGQERANFLFLDSLSVIEDGYKRKKDLRDVELTTVEDCLLGLTSRNADLLSSYHPREFEYFVASLLTKIGFSKVRMSRFWNDSGWDIWATYCEGDQVHQVVVEVKAYSKKKVGIAIVDRLNGVRDRTGADRGMVVTRSSFSREAVAAYTALKEHIALVDYDRLTGLLQDSGNWHKTPSGLWAPNTVGNDQSQGGGSHLKY